MSYPNLADFSATPFPMWAHYASVVGPHIDGRTHLVFSECDPASGLPGEVARASMCPHELIPAAGTVFSVRH